MKHTPRAVKAFLEDYRTLYRIMSLEGDYIISHRDAKVIEMLEAYAELLQATKRLENKKQTAVRCNRKKKRVGLKR